MTGFLKTRKKDECCGCGACQNVCPVNCIIMQQDDEGYDYPVIQTDNCIGCGRCHKACSWESDKSFHFTGDTEPDSYAVWHKNINLRQQSTSGGAFSALAATILGQGGSVIGAKFMEDFSVAHDMACTKDECMLFCGSKYVQSDLRDNYRKIADRLKQNRPVFFTGTPCQVAGLYAFLGQDDINLTTAEIVCHGVTSPGLWKEYLQYLQHKEQSSIASIAFRDKSRGWGHYLLRIVFQNGTVRLKKAMNDFFYRVFLVYYFVRPSCYKCIYKKLPREADLTLADFWGVEKLNTGWDISKGVSLVLVNSEKGKVLLDNSKNNMEVNGVPLSQTLQANLCENHVMPKGRELFFQRYYKKDFRKLLFNYMTLPLFLGFPCRILQYIVKKPRV